MAKSYEVVIDTISRQSQKAFWKKDLYLKYYATTFNHALQGKEVEYGIITVIETKIRSMQVISPRQLLDTRGYATYVPLADFLRQHELNLTDINRGYLMDKFKEVLAARQIWVADNCNL